MHRTKILTGADTVALSLLALGACGKKDKDDAAESAAGATAGAMAPAPAAGATTGAMTGMSAGATGMAGMSASATKKDTTRRRRP